MRISAVADYKQLESVSPEMITEELKERAELTYTLIATLLQKECDSEEDLKKRIGLASSVILNLASQQMSVYASKLGVMLIASGKILFSIRC